MHTPSLTACHFGLGQNRCSVSSGGLRYTPKSSVRDNAEGVVDELSTLLTSGRMSNRNRQVVVDALSNAYANTNNPRKALLVAQQLIVSSSEFHTTSLPKNSHKERETTNTFTSTKSCKRYKAVVHLVLEGGMDSYNLLGKHLFQILL